MTSARTVHISRTPLVGAPGKLVNALNRHTGFESALIVAQDYPTPLKGLFLDSVIPFEAKGAAFELCRSLIRSADIIHVHNDLPDELGNLVRSEAGADCRFLYQVHSPLREGPLFVDRSGLLGLEFAAKLTIPHYPQRFFPDFTLVPNLTLHTPSLRRLSEGERVRILFSPAHDRRGTRWGDKVSDGLNRVLKGLNALRLAEVIDVRGMAPTALMELRRTTHITIDEIVTGAFHQVSLEGLAAGNVVVNNADALALLSLQAACRAPEPPPFYRVDESQVPERMLALVTDRERIVHQQEKSFDFFMQYLRPERLVRRFVEIYEEVLS